MDNDVDGLFTNDELSAAKDNFFTILGELYNGETLNIMLSDVEKELTDETKVTLPDGMISNKKLKVFKDKNAFAIILNIFINLLMQLNPIKEESENLYELKIAIITAICLNGTITSNKNYHVSETKFDKDYILKNKSKISNDNLKIIERIIAKLPLANNFAAFATINYVKFNHHFPSDKTHLIRKALLTFDPKTVDEMLDRDNLDLFYDTLVAPVKINNEFIFYEKFVNKSLENLHEVEFRYYNLLGCTPVTYKDDVILIRKECTPNGFIVLDLINVLIQDLKAKNVLFLLPKIEIFAQLLKIREYIRKNPFGYHPSKIIYHTIAKDFEEIHKSFVANMAIIGGFMYTYTASMEDSVLQAKCRLKYKNKVNLQDDKMVQFLNTIISSPTKFDDNKVNILREKLNTFNIEINDELDIKKENEKAYEKINKVLGKN